MSDFLGAALIVGFPFAALWLAWVILGIVG